MSNLFAKLEYEAFRAGINPRTKEAQSWFRKKAQQMKTPNRMELLSDEQLKLVNKQNPLIGSMNMFFYDPKTKDTLPYYDRFPLAIIVGPAPKGFYGLNLHYLPPMMRAKVLNAVLGGEGIPQNFFAPAMKRYLFSQVRSQFALVDKPEWEIATFLPTANWNKASASKVYADSRAKAR